MAPRVVTVVGARPQFVKAAVVSAALAREGLSEVLVHTGQHYDAALSDVFFEELGLPPPARHLGIGGLSHGAMTGRMLEAIETVLVEERPDWVLVYGDTNSTVAGALAAAKLHIPVAHVEAGMRSYNRRMPEEQNRVVTDHLATLHLVTSDTPRGNLEREGISSGIHVVGDVMLDAVRIYGASAERKRTRDELGIVRGGFGLVTLHRAENTDSPERFAAILDALGDVSRELPLVFSVHPRTQKLLEQQRRQLPDTIRILPPVSYFEMLNLELGARIILTDSGGVQKEALYAGVPCVTLRDETEWTETVDLGWNVLAGADRARIVAAARRFLAQSPEAGPPPIYGDGAAGSRIARILRDTK
jgi:UDP-N-acetylglucosamine 2-epimerase